MNKKVIKLTENQLKTIIENVIREQSPNNNLRDILQNVLKNDESKTQIDIDNKKRLNTLFNRYKKNEDVSNYLGNALDSFNSGYSGEWQEYVRVLIGKLK